MYKKAELSNGLSSIELVSDSENDSRFFRTLENKGIKLNQNQIEVVRHDVNPLLVDSCAGSGKSTTIAARISYLVSVRNVIPDSIMLITFTRKASEEMLTKAKKFATVDEKVINKITSGTFHSVFLRFLREEWENREIYSSEKSRQICIKTILRKLSLDDGRYEPEDILAMISHYKNRAMNAEDFEASSRGEREFQSIWKEYEKYKIEHKLIDFDDIILLCYKKMKTDERFLNKIRSRYKYIMIDEFQDTSLLQHDIIKLIAHPHNNVVAVGDLDQCIFSYAGARVSNILEFEINFPNSKSIKLDTNYRSVNTILGLGNAVIQQNQKRTDKVSLSVKPSDEFPVFLRPFSSDDEATYITNYIQDKITKGEYTYKDFAVLYRNASNSRAIFEEFLLNEIPFIQYGNGEDTFYENSIVRPLLAYLKVINKPDDLKSISEILPTMYLGKDKMEFIKKSQKEKLIKNPLQHVLNSGMKPFQRSKVADKIRQIENLKNVKPLIIVKRLRDDYETYLFGEDDKLTTTMYREIVKETIDEFENSIKRFDTIDELTTFVDMIIKNNKIQKELQKKPDYNGVRMMSIHKSKGLEFPVVFILHMVENVLPFRSALEECTDIVPTDNSFDAIEEERRLAYVAITRSQEKLLLSSPQTLRGREVEPSRFIAEYIPNTASHEDELIYG